MDKQPVEPIARRLTIGTDEITILATCAETHGTLFAVEVRMQPGGGPPVMHRHAPGEVYHVLEGEFTFYIDDGDGEVRRVTAAAGETVPLAGGTPHTVRNESTAAAVAFSVHAPGEPMESFMRGAAALADDGAPTMEAVMKIAQEHGIEMLGPVPVA